MEEKNNGRSITSLVLGVLSVTLVGVSLIVLWWLGIVGAVLGIIGIFVGKEQESKAGFTTSIIGAVVGTIVSIVMVIIVSMGLL